jgi:hypothetical protein
LGETALDQMLAYELTYAERFVGGAIFSAM